MTRPLAGPSSQRTRTRTPNVLPIGHLSTKSSVYSPVSMSRMSQDLAYNHMKSHYQRVSSAKACVDTSAPKSMKLTIKEKDRRRKEALLTSKIGRTTPRLRKTINGEPLNSRRNSASNPSHINGHETSSVGQFRNERPSSRETLRRERNLENGDSHQTHYDRKLNHAYDARLNSDSVRLNEQSYTPYQRTRHKIDQKSSREDLLRGQMNESTKPESSNTPEASESSNTPEASDLHQTKRGNWNDLRNETFENGIHTTSTPRREMFEVEPSLSMTTFSYKSPPTRRNPRRKTAEDLIWTEEQKYLQFISDVTSDVLARGICSNRVINRVFESHIEKRKYELNEENMREMIDQLKEDLGVIDD